MERKLYFEKMAETSKEVNLFILEKGKKENNLNHIISNLPQFKKRIRKDKKLRPFLLRLAYELNGGNNWRELIPASAAIELLNVSTYTDNAVLDSKGNIKDERDYLIVGRLLRNLASKIIKRNYRDKNLEELLEEIDVSIYTGQYHDLHQFSYNEVTKMSEKEYMQHYIERCYNLTGKFLENVAMMGSLLAEKPSEKMRDFGKNFGISVQIINDIGDFVPPTLRKGCDLEKIYQDQYSDIKNGKITLPIYYALKNCEEKDKSHLIDILFGRKKRIEDLLKATEILLKTGAIDHSKKIAGRFARNAKKAISSYDVSTPRTYLSLMAQMYRINKYLVTLRSIRDG